MPMRDGCKHYESRTYANGETVRQCRLDLAPEAPWRCPAACPAFVPRLADVGWQRGSLTPDGPPPEPPRLDADVMALLDQAEDIVNAAGPAILSEVEIERAKEQAAHRKRSAGKRGGGGGGGVGGFFSRLYAKLPKPPER